MGKIGLQLYSVKEAAEKNFLGTIKRVAEMGYDGVQFAGFFDTPAEDLKKVLEDYRVTAAGSHMSLDSLQGENLARTLEYNRIIGNDLIICPYLPEELRNTADDYKKTAELFNKIGQKCTEAGVRFAYHNHNFEFKLYDGQTGFDILFGNTDSQLVKVELDCYWASFGGLDPRDIIKKYGDRVVSLHIKYMKIVDGVKRSVEIGAGELDIKGLLHTGDQAAVEWYVVEQEQFDGDPMESSLINIENLKSKVFN